MIRGNSLKNLLWFTAVLLMAVSFPLQVYTNSPYPSLLPYVVIGLIGLLNVVSSKPHQRHDTRIRRHGNIDLMVRTYVFLALMNTTLQAVVGVIDLDQMLSALSVFLLPVVWYSYFSRNATEGEIRSVLAAMVVAGLIVGIYFAYDSYLKLALGRISDYADRAFQYSAERTSQTAEANTARISQLSRSFGLLQSHAVSGAWVALGAFAALSLVPLKRRLIRRATILLFAIMLFLGLNFTSIVAYSIIILLFEFGGLPMLRGRVIPAIRNVVPLAMIIAAGVGATLWIAGDSMARLIFDIVTAQQGLAFGTGGGDVTIVGLAVGAASTYLRHVEQFPHTLLFGDGFSTFGMMKGGDVGFIETLAMFGLPFYLATLLGFFALMRMGVGYDKHIRHDDSLELNRASMLQLAMSITLLILICDGHYSLWPAKAILPMVFFALALYGRYLPIGLRRELRYEAAMHQSRQPVTEL